MWLLGSAQQGEAPGEGPAPRDPRDPLTADPRVPCAPRPRSLSPLAPAHSVCLSVPFLYFELLGRLHVFRSSHFPFRESPLLVHLFSSHFYSLRLLLLVFLYLYLNTHPLSPLFVSDTLCVPLCGLVSVSWWLLVCVYGWGSRGLAYRDAAGFSTVSCLFGEGWQERTWDVGSC